MQYIKATKQQCQTYDNEVTQGENYQGSTTQWAEVKEIEGCFYIAVHPNYTTELLTVNELPTVDELPIF